jgi:hypothetical protein
VLDSSLEMSYAAKCGLAARSGALFHAMLMRAVVMFGLLTCGAASAQPSAPPTQRSEEARAYYGWQTLATDALGLSLLALSSEIGHATVPAVIGVGSLLFGAPVIHGVHHHWFGLGVSLGLRIGSGLALLGGLKLLADVGDEGAAGGFVLLGCGVLGSLSALLLDAIVLGFEPRPRASALTWTPHIDPRGELGLQLRAAF